MRKFILLLVASAAVTMSFVARAEGLRDVPAAVEAISFDSATRTIAVSGNLPTPCAFGPRPTLQATARPDVLLLTIVASQAADLCTAALGNRYELAFDVFSLRHELGLIGLPENGSYTIVTRDGGLMLPVDFSAAQGIKRFSSKTLVAEIFATADAVVAKADDGTFFNLKSPVINVAEYVGSTVQLQGHALRMKTPALNKLAPDEATISVLVTGIHTVR